MRMKNPRILLHTAVRAAQPERGWHRPGELAVAAILLAAVAVGIVREVRAAYGPFNEWSVGEWLINYHGGFIRRGLPGEVIHWLATVWHVSPITSAVAVSLVSYGMLAVLVFLHGMGLLFMPTMLSAVALGAFPLGGYLIRKDAFLLVLFAIAVTITASASRSGSPMRTLTGFLATNVLAVVAILSHESFAFFGLPGLVLIAATTGGRLRPARGLLWILPAIAAMVAVLTSTGSPSHAAAIHASWQHLPEPLPPGRLADPRGPQGAIWFLKHTPREAAGAARIVLEKVDRQIFWEPVMWFLTALAALCFVRERPYRPHASHADGDNQRTGLWLAIALEGLAIAPLFLIAYDWGRWIALWLTSSILIAPYLVDSHSALASVGTLRVVASLTSRMTRWADALPRAPETLPWFLLVFGNPGWSWELTRYAKSTPLGTLLDLVMP